MFQPQSTPYAPFSYGVGTPIPNFPAFQPAGGGVGGQQQQQQHNQVVDSGGPTVFSNPIFSPVATNVNNAGGILSFTGGHHHHNDSISASQHFKMDGGDLDAQQALAREYQPALEGPLVGEKKSSHAITAEYAKADPVYVAKTAALPQKYSHYRPISGDGNCGWRAAGFSYFETLLRLQNAAQLDGERARMTSLNNLLITIGGFEEWVFEDMAEETTSLLKDLASLVEASPHAAAQTLRERFNQSEVSNAIVYHLRLLASSWLRANSATYQGFIPDGLGIDGYCKNWLEPVNQEIDHLGMTLLIDVLLKPIGFAVEIVYLDRSEGSQANSHIFQSEDANGAPTNPGGPMIHLLYRPSHYDILYKEAGSSIPFQHEEVTRNSNILVNRATNFSHRHNVQSTTASMGDFSQLDLSALLSIPGFGMQPQSNHGFPPQYHSPIEQSSYAHSPISTSISPMPSSAAATPTSTNSLPQTFPVQPTQSSNLNSPAVTSPHATFPPATTQLPIHTHLTPPGPHGPSVLTHPSLSPHPALNSELASPSSATSSFRPSKYEWAAAADWQEPVVFQTSTFKNSHYNTAHYNNPNFQPEEWSPEAEEGVGLIRKRST